MGIASCCWRKGPTGELLVTREGSYVMEQVLCEPVELTEFELDAVAGGRISFSHSFNIESEPVTRITNYVDNSVNVQLDF